jgi:hypothetical protein
MSWATFWATFSQTHLVALIAGDRHPHSLPHPQFLLLDQCHGLGSLPDIWSPFHSFQVAILPNKIFRNFTHICNILSQKYLIFLQVC